MQKNAAPCPAFLDSGNTAAEPQRDFFYPHGDFYTHFTGSCISLARQGEEREQEILSYTLPSIVTAFLLAIAVLLKEASSHSH